MINFYFDKSNKFIILNSVLQFFLLILINYKLSTISSNLLIFFSFMWFLASLFYENYFYNNIFLKFFRFLEDEVDKINFINQIILYLVIISFVIFIICILLIIIKNIFFLKLNNFLLDFKIINLFLSTFFVLSSSFLLTISQNKFKIYLSILATYILLYLIIYNLNFNYEINNFIYFGLIYIIPLILLINLNYIKTIKLIFDDRILYFYKKLFLGFVISNNINVIFFITIILLFTFGFRFFDLILIFNLIFLSNIIFIQHKFDYSFNYLFNNSSTISIKDSIKFQNKLVKEVFLRSLLIIIVLYSIYFLSVNFFKLSSNSYIFFNKINFLIILLTIIPLSFHRLFLTFIFYREEVSSKEPFLISLLVFALFLPIIIFLIYFKLVNMIPILIFLISVINLVLFTYLMQKKNIIFLNFKLTKI